MRRESYKAASRWMEKAGSDLRACEILLAADALPLDVVCFHAQQAAEKSLKALLTARAIPFAKTHHLPTPSALLPGAFDVGLSLDEQVELTYFAVRPRYPDDLVEIDGVPAERLTGCARSCFGSAERWLETNAPK